MKQRVSVVWAKLVVCCIVILPGCKRSFDWAAQHFNQGQSVALPLQRVKPYVRSVAIHNYFSTKGIFDALWLSDEVRSAYADIAAVRSGKSTQQAQLFLRRQIEENKHYITFYVLSEYDVPLGDTSDWHVLLQVGEYTYQPCELKTVDLVPEYKAFFGRRWSKLKTAYVVKFDAQDVNDQSIISPSTQSMALCFHATSKRAELVWSLDGAADQVRGVA